MFCDSKATILDNLKGKGEASVKRTDGTTTKENPLLSEYNQILDRREFDVFNKEYTRFLELKYNLKTDGELAFGVYETQTRNPYTSRTWRDDIKVTQYAQPNESLFEALDEERIRLEIQEDEGFEIEKEPDSIFPVDESLDPMYNRSNSKLNDEFDRRVKTAMLGFLKGLNIQVEDNLDEIVTAERRAIKDADGNIIGYREDSLAAFDVLQKFLALKKDIPNKVLTKQTAAIIQTFLGKKSKLGIEIYKSINNWSRYQEIYDRYNKNYRAQTEDESEKNELIDDIVFEDDFNIYDGSSMENEILSETYRYDPTRFNPWAHKQVIIEFISQMLTDGLNQNYTGQKRTNPDISKEYFESIKYKDKFEETWYKRIFNKLWNWLQANIFNNKAITIYSEQELTDVVMDIVDDVYKKDFNKFIRSYYEDQATGEFKSFKGEIFERKYYEESLSKDPFAANLLDKLFGAPFQYRLSGSLVLRKYGRVLRALNEDLHDIDGVITLEQFESEKNSEKFLKWIDEVGLPLSKTYSKKNSEKFLKEITPYLEGQSWYQDLKKMFPSWNLEVSFIGRDHKKGESITISGYIENPDDMILVESGDGSAKNNFFKAEDVGKMMPRRYVLDFFLRTREGDYPEIFDNFYKDWKQIFEAKVKMGRGKDLTDLIYFIPDRTDRYKFTNKGFRYFVFADDVNVSPVESDFVSIKDRIEKQQAREAAEALAEKLALSMNAEFMNITEEEAKQIHDTRKKPYNGEPAFFFGNTVYVVGDNVNIDTVLHEFSHPFLRAISRENPVLFNNLYESLIATSEGEIIKDHVIKNYPELNETYLDKDGKVVNNPYFMEEVLAYGLQRRASNRVTQEIETEGFKGFINKMLNAIRDILKKVFGRIPVGIIDESTSLTKLADLFLDKSFKIKAPNVTEEDVFAYARNLKDLANDLTKDMKAERIQESINEMYTTNQLIYEKAKNFKLRSPLYRKMLQEALMQKNTNELLPKISRQLANYETVSNREKFSIDDVLDGAIDAESRRNVDILNRARAFVNTVSVVNNISQNIFNNLDTIQKSDEFSNREAISLLFLYRSSIRSWNDMFNTFDELLLEEVENGFDITKQNDLVDLVNEAKNNLLRADKKIRDIYKANSINFYVEITGYMNDFLKEELGRNLKNALTDKLSKEEIDEIYDLAITQKLDAEKQKELFEQLEKKGIQSQYIKKFIDDYNYFLINQDKITDGLSGKLKDVSWFNRFFESYTSSNDPIVGGLSVFINDQKTEAEQRALEKSYKFRKQLQPLLEKVGYNTLKTRQVLDLVGFKDKVLYIDPKTKEAKEREVLSFLNEFGNGWRYEYDLLEYNVDKAWASDDKEQIKEAVNNLKQFKKDYMWDQYIPEFYEKDTIFEKYGDVGKMAWLERKMALDAFNNEANELTDELERFQEFSTLQSLWSKYQNLYSYLYEDMSPKVDDPANGIYDLTIAKILNEHREATSDYYEFIPRVGSLQTAYDEFLSRMDSENITGDELEKAKDEWKKQNTRRVYKPEFYESRKELISRLKELQSKINRVIGEDFDIANAYSEIYNISFAYKDSQGEVVPSDLGIEKIRRVKELNQKIIDYKANFDTKTGLTNEEAEELDIFIAINKKNPERLTKEQKARYIELLEKQTKNGLSLNEVAEMQSIYSELSSLTQKVATEYYVDALNEHLQRLEVPTVAAEKVDEFINSDEIKNLLKDDKFAEWFRDNHVYKKQKNFKTKKLEIKYERSMVNSVSLPKNPDYYEQTKLINTITGKEETIIGLPNSRHSMYRVKNKYRTGYNPETGDVELEVGVHIDNKGQFLPRMFNPNDKNSAKDSKFINQDYLRLKEQPSSPRFQLLDLMKKAHLEFQEDKSNRSKLYLDIPRYVLRDNLSKIQAGKIGERYSQVKKGIQQSLTDAFGKAVDEVELEHNYERDNNLEEYRLVNTDLNSEEVSYIPVSGIYNIDIDNTDPDVIRGMFKYLLSLETQSQLLQTLPLVNSILETLEDPKNAPKTENTFSKTINKARGKLVETTKKGASNNRLGQVRSLIDREYYGKQFRGEGSSIYLDKFIGQLQKLSSRASLAINISSDLKNRYGQIVQNMIESAGGEFVTVKDLAKARLWATTTMLEWSTKSVYEKGVPKLDSQLIEMFDSAFKFVDDFGRSVSRNFAKDMMNGEWMYNIRKNLEMEASLQLFGAFLNAQKVEQKLSNGKTITINYKDAWQINKETGIAELKPGIDAAFSNKAVYHDYIKGQTLQEIADMYNVTVEELKDRNKIENVIELEDGQEIVIAKSEKFKQFRNKFQGVSHRLYGAYDKFAQSEGNMYLPYRMFTFMRKWFIPMFTNRVGASVEIEDGKWWKPKFQKRYDWMTGKNTIGFYVNAFVGLKELIKSKGKYWAYMPQDQKADLMRTLTESLFIIAIALVTSMLFGYDPDDPDRFEKMRERSGAWGTDEFKTWGFIQNHTLLLLLGAQAETSAFLPLPTMFGVNLGIDDYIKMGSTTTSAFGNTVSLYAKILEDIFRMVALNEKAYYSRDEGEYFWQKQGAPKIIGHALKTVGITGSTGDVTQALEGLENAGKLK